jgi:hypothetical protein
MSTVTPIYICPSATAGTAWGTAWLPCTAGGGLALPNPSSIVAAQLAAHGYANYWQSASLLQPTDQVWTGTGWVKAATVTIAPLAPPAPPPPPPPTPPPATQTVALTSGESLEVTFPNSATITIAAS